MKPIVSENGGSDYDYGGCGNESEIGEHNWKVKSLRSLNAHKQFERQKMRADFSVLYGSIGTHYGLH